MRKGEVRMEKQKLMFTAGQRKIYKEGEAPIKYERVPFTKVEVLKDIPALEVHPKFADKDYVVTADVTEMIPGVTSEMVDWWWGNMEKGYHIWAPGEHYGFDWIVPPVEVGYEGSVEASYEFDPVHPIVLTRRSIDEYPFTDCYEHCWMSSGMLGPVATTLIHMYQDVPGGIYWRSVQFMTKDDAALMAANADKMPDVASHMEYESGRLNAFLPQLYELWKNHPDPYENIHYDLTTKKNEDGTWSHVSKNLPPQ